MSSAVLAGPENIQGETSIRQLDGPASLQLRTDVLAKDRDLCVVDLPDPKTCALNQTSYFTLFFEVYSLVTATLSGQRTLNHIMLMYISYLKHIFF